VKTPDSVSEKCPIKTDTSHLFCWRFL